MVYTVARPLDDAGWSVAVHSSADTRANVWPPRVLPGRANRTVDGVNVTATYVELALRLCTRPLRHSITDESVATRNVESENDRIPIVVSFRARYCSKKDGYAPPLPRQLPTIHCNWRNCCRVTRAALGCGSCVAGASNRLRMKAISRRVWMNAS